MINDYTYFRWTCTRLIRAAVKVLFLYPVMLVCCIPYGLYMLCLTAVDTLNMWWWE